MKTVILLFFALFFHSCTNSKTVSVSKDTIVSITTKTEEKDTINEGQGFCIYSGKPQYAAGGSFEVDTINVADTPFIAYNNILLYDTISHIIRIKKFPFYDWGKEKVKKTLYRSPFVVTLDNKRLYGGWFTASISSVPYSWVVINLSTSKYTKRDDEFMIQLGYPNEKQFRGTDPRNNRALFDRLKADGKIKQN